MRRPAWLGPDAPPAQYEDIAPARARSRCARPEALKAMLAPPRRCAWPRVLSARLPAGPRIVTMGTVPTYVYET
ncbi:MAG TPA: hypothetical protein VFQ61_22715, partial [Polyangiaceae bacterium]|nr:hypothetical protein [Polyangiaceae bacterium]